MTGYLEAMRLMIRLGCAATHGCRIDNMKSGSTPIWVWIAVIAAGIALGLGLRPLLQASNGGGSSTTEPAAIRCAGPDGSELALSEFITSGVDGTSASYSRRYQLERPGQVPLAFSAESPDADSAAIDCAFLRFGPGPRIAFTRAQSVNIIELVGPTVKSWNASSDRTLGAVLLEPRWKLGLKLPDYQMGAAEIDESGKLGRVTLTRVKPDPAFPQRLNFTSVNGGSTWALDKQKSLTGF